MIEGECLGDMACWEGYAESLQGLMVIEYTMRFPRAEGTYVISCTTTTHVANYGSLGRFWASFVFSS
jgi:hypothetical protein